MLSLAALPLSWVAAQIVTQIIHSRVIERNSGARYGGGLGMKPGSPAALCGPGLSSTGGWVSPPHINH